MGNHLGSTVPKGTLGGYYGAYREMIDVFGVERFWLEIGWTVVLPQVAYQTVQVLGGRRVVPWQHYTVWDSRCKHGTPHDRGLRLALLFRNKLLSGPARVKRELYRSLSSV